MSKLFTRLYTSLTIITVLVLVYLQSLAAKPVLSEKLGSPSFELPTIVATAAAPPTLVSAKLGGKPVHVLYMTRAGDTVLVRCYPGYQPTITVRAMGSKPSADAPIEGVMTCKPTA
jgi:hypothetical protein